MLPPTAAAAGPNQSLCAPTAVLAANSPVVGTGQWSVSSAEGAEALYWIPIQPPLSMEYLELPIFCVGLRRNGVCSTQDDVQIHFYPIPDVLAADKTICSGSNANVAISNPNGIAGTTYSWTVFSSTNVTGAAAGNGSLISQILTILLA